MQTNVESLEVSSREEELMNKVRDRTMLVVFLSFLAVMEFVIIFGATRAAPSTVGIGVCPLMPVPVLRRSGAGSASRRR